MLGLFVFSLVAVVTLQMRSFAALAATCVFVFAELSVMRVIIYSATAVAFGVGVIVFRDGLQLTDIHAWQHAAQIFVAGPAEQVDFYFLAKEFGWHDVAAVNEALSQGNSMYLDQGGGFGSFLNLEAWLIAGSFYTLPLCGLLLTLVYLTRASSAIAQIALVTTGILSFEIIRNPVSAWIHAWITMVVLTSFALVQARHEKSRTPQHDTQIYGPSRLRSASDA
jgi:hypothetical protein